jgi:hypothetical protein
VIPRSADEQARTTVTVFGFMPRRDDSGALTAIETTDSTGVLISDRHVLTVAHARKTATAEFFVFPAPSPERARSIPVDVVDAFDLMILERSEPDAQASSPVLGTPRQGDGVVVYARPQLAAPPPTTFLPVLPDISAAPIAMHGRIARLLGCTHFEMDVTNTAEQWGGMFGKGLSGSPVYDADGALLGMITMGGEGRGIRLLRAVRVDVFLEPAFAEAAG